MSTHPLTPVLAPASIAVVGASQNPEKRGHQVVRALVEDGFSGRIVPVNPAGGSLLGLEVEPSVQEIAAPCDLAYLSLPANMIPDAVRDCAASGIRGAVIPAVGFRETGEQGLALEREIREVVVQTGIRVVGPNTSGIINTACALNLVGARPIPSGSLAVLAQSGNVALDVMNTLGRYGTGLSIYVGVGNEVDITFDEYLSFLECDPNTSAVLVYVEGFRDGRKFLDVASRVCHTKPIVLLKGGRSASGVAAAQSHTGAIAGSYPVLRSALRQHGINEVLRSDELVPVGHALAFQPPVPDGLGTAIITDGGGHGTLIADAIVELGGLLSQPSETTERRLRELVGHAGTVKNPIDLAGAADRDPMVFARVAATLLSDPTTGGVVVVGLFGGYAIRFDSGLAQRELEAAHQLVRAAREHNRLLIVHTLYAHRNSSALEYLRAEGVPVLGSLEIAARCVRALQVRGEFLARDRVELVVQPSTEPNCLVMARREGRNTLLETEVRDLLVHAGVTVPPYIVCRTGRAAVTAATEMGGAVALKIVSPSISHKTDAGGVALNVKGKRQVAETFKRIVAESTAYLLEHNLPPDIRGVLVTPMLPQPVAELIVGVHQDPDYGPVLTVGAGGVTVEVHQDTALRGLPISRTDVLEMLNEIRIARILSGFRGQPGADTDAIANLALSVAACALRHPGIDSLEVNPAFAYADRVDVVDARAFLVDGG